MADVNSIRPAAVVEASAEADGTIAPAPATEAHRNPLRRALIAAPPTIDIGRVAAIVVVPVFCWVFFTTSSGMIDIMRRESSDLVGVIGAIIGTSAILVMLAATSWSLGADLGALIARRQIFGERMVVKTSVTAIVYLFVFSISAFFSFTYYYTNIFRLSSKKMVAELQPMALAADVLLPAAKAAAPFLAEIDRVLDAPPALRSKPAMSFPPIPNFGSGNAGAARKKAENASRLCGDREPRRGRTDASRLARPYRINSARGSGRGRNSAPRNPTDRSQRVQTGLDHRLGIQLRHLRVVVFAGATLSAPAQTLTELLESRAEGFPYSSGSGRLTNQRVG